ncbi:MAG: ABC transporter substrate-binding protein [Mycobacteriales bacterium]
MRSTITSRGARAAAGACALTLTLVACGSESDTAGGDGKTIAGGEETTSLSFGVTNPDLPGSAYYAAVPTYLEYWTDEGLDVTFDAYNGTGEVMTAVATGKTDVGSGGTMGAMAAVVNGGADLKVFYSYIPNNPYWPVVMPDSDIDSLDDLVGKTVGTFSLAGDGAGLLKGVMEAEGLDPNSVDIVAVGVGAEAYETLKSGRIAAYIGYDSVYGQIEALGHEIRRIDSPIDDFGWLGGIAAPATMIKGQRETLVTFGRGLAKAAVFTKANPECALKIQWEVYPESKPAGVADDQAVKDGVESLMSRLKSQFPVDEQWGRVAERTVQERIDIAVESGELAKPLPVEEIWDPSLLDDMNDFDVAEIEKAAADCRMVEG